MPLRFLRCLPTRPLRQLARGLAPWSAEQSLEHRIRRQLQGPSRLPMAALVYGARSRVGRRTRPIGIDATRPALEAGRSARRLGGPELRLGHARLTEDEESETHCRENRRHGMTERRRTSAPSRTSLAVLFSVHHLAPAAESAGAPRALLPRTAPPGEPSITGTERPSRRRLNLRSASVGDLPSPSVDGTASIEAGLTLQIDAQAPRFAVGLRAFREGAPSASAMSPCSRASQRFRRKRTRPHSGLSDKASPESAPDAAAMPCCEDDAARHAEYAVESVTP